MQPNGRIVMATRFTKEESILSLAHLAAHKDGATDTETGFIHNKLKPFYMAWTKK